MDLLPQNVMRRLDCREWRAPVPPLVAGRFASPAAIQLVPGVLHRIPSGVVDTDMTELRTRRAEGVAMRKARTAAGLWGSLVVAQIIRSARSHTCDIFFIRPM